MKIIYVPFAGLEPVCKSSMKYTNTCEVCNKRQECPAVQSKPTLVKEVVTNEVLKDSRTEVQSQVTIP